MTEASRKLYGAIAAIMAAVIVYGSLFPFDFAARPGSATALDALIQSWNVPPSSWGDLVANVLLYMPLGFFLMPALGQNRVWHRLFIVTVVGFALCTTMELAQYYDETRVTNMSDLYLNTGGTLLGGLGGLFTRDNFRWLGLGNLARARVPTMLLFAWLGYRLFPYVPTIDRHKYLDALQPLLLHPSVTGYDLGRYVVLWLTVAALVAAAIGARRAWLGLAAIILCVVVGDIFILDRETSVARVDGAVVAVALWPLVARLGARTRHLLIAFALLAVIVAERLEPFDFSVAADHGFQWIPFYSFMVGSLAVDIQSFFEKFFLYGSAVWMLARAGLRMNSAALLVAAALFATSLAETHLPERSAEVTDALMALVIAWIIALMEHAARDDGPAGATGSAASGATRANRSRLSAE